jgi:hypothetical protein
METQMLLMEIRILLYVLISICYLGIGFVLCLVDECLILLRKGKKEEIKPTSFLDRFLFILIWPFFILVYIVRGIYGNNEH